MIVQRIIGENSTDSTNIPYISLPVRPLYIYKIEEVGSDLLRTLLRVFGSFPVPTVLCVQVYREVAATMARMHSIALPPARRVPGVGAAPGDHGPGVDLPPPPRLPLPRRGHGGAPHPPPAGAGGQHAQLREDTLDLLTLHYKPCDTCWPDRHPGDQPGHQLQPRGVRS